MSDTSPSIERLKQGRIQISLTVPPEEVVRLEGEILRDMSKHMNIQGFRPGHAPLDLVRSKVGADGLLEEIARKAVSSALPPIVMHEKIEPVLPPKVQITSNTPLTLQIILVEKPKVTLKHPEKIAPPKKKITVDPKDLERVISQVRRDYRTKKPADHPAKQGDEVRVTFHADDKEGKDIPGLRAEKYEVLIGEAGLLPGFEEKLIGLKPGESTSFELVLPEKFPVEDLRNKPAVFHVTMDTVEDVTLPELTDAFVQEHLHAASAEEFKAKVEETLRTQEEQMERMNREQKLLEEIRAHTVVDLADELLEEEMRSMLREWQENLEKRGMNMAEALKQQGKKPEELEKDLRAQAVERWKLRLGLSALMEQQKVEVTHEDLAAAFDRYKATLPEGERAGADRAWEEGTLRDELRWRTLVEKTIEKMLA